MLQRLETPEGITGERPENKDQFENSEGSQKNVYEKEEVRCVNGEG